MKHSLGSFGFAQDKLFAPKNGAQDTEAKGDGGTGHIEIAKTA
jgi:hypothetical protein